MATSKSEDHLPDLLCEFCEVYGLNYKFTLQKPLAQKLFFQAPSARYTHDVVEAHATAAKTCLRCSLSSSSSKQSYLCNI